MFLKELSKACFDELRSDQLANGTRESFQRVEHKSMERINTETSKKGT